MAVQKRLKPDLARQQNNGSGGLTSEVLMTTNNWEWDN